MNVIKLELLIFLINKVDYYWNIFYIVNGTLLSLLLTDNIVVNDLTVFVLLSLVYVSFMIFSCKAHIRAYQFLKACIEDIAKDKDLINSFPNTKLYIKRLIYKRTRALCPYVYCVISFIILYLFWHQNYVW